MTVAVAAAVGVVINLVTDGFTWTMAAVVVGLVAAQAALSLWQGRQDQHDRRAARDELLGPLRPEVPDGAPGLVFRLTSPYSPTRLWGRGADRDRLVAWCTGGAAGAARVITGPAGVGKSRLALAVAEALPEGWVAGRLLAVGSLVERIAAAGEPTLVVVDDADRVAGLDVLLTQAVRHPDLVRLVLLTRDLKDLRPVPDVVLPHLVEVPLTPIGEPSDRERWFAEAVRAYAKTLGVPSPDLPARPVGDDGDTLLLLHARALLAALGRSGSRSWSLRELATELVTLEQRTWDLPGHDTEVLAEAITVLALTPTGTPAEALRHVPQLAHDSSHESRAVVARWAQRHRELPHLVGERLLVDTLTRTPELFHDQAAVSPLAHAYDTFPDALDPLLTAVTNAPDLTPVRLAELFATGVTGRDLDHGLAARVSANTKTLPDLAALVVPQSFPHLGCAVGSLAVASLRLVPGGRHALAAALDDLGDRLHAVGRFPEALGAHQEAVVILRDLSADPPDLAAALTRLGRSAQQLGDFDLPLAALQEVVAIRRAAGGGELVFALGNLAVALEDLGRLDEALAASSEAVAIGRRLPDIDDHRFAIALENHGTCLLRTGHVREGIAVTEEAVETFRGPGGDPLHLATASKNLGNGLWQLGRFPEALAATAEATSILTGLAAAEPDRYDAALAGALLNHSGVLRDLGRFQEAHAASLAAVGAERRSGDRRTGLATALGSHGTSLLQLGRVGEALAVFEEAVPLWRALAASHRPLRGDLASLLVNVAIASWMANRHQEALDTITEAADTFRTLADTEPARHGPVLAQALTNLGGMLRESGRVAEAEQVHRECVAVWKSCVDREPGRYEPSFAAAQARLRELTG